MAGPTSSPARSSEGSSGHGPLACFLLRSLAATPEMGGESPSDVQEHLIFTSGSPCKQPGKGTRAPGM